MTQPIDSSRRITDPWAADPPPTRGSTAPARDLDPSALPLGNVDIRAFLQAAGPACPAVVAPPPDVKTAAQSKLDAYRDSFAGPYRVGGKEVSAPAQFRMPNGANDHAAGFYRKPDGTGDIHTDRSPTKELFAICARGGAPSPRACLLGCPKAEDLVRVTQALLDAGRLEDGPGDASMRIRAMQWKFGIGIDCTDYTVGAAMQAADKRPGDLPAGMRPAPGSDYFATAATNPHLKQVSLAAAQPGDVFCLDPVTDPVGHRAVVYAARTCNANRVLELGINFGPDAAKFLEGGPVRELELDASWGAGKQGSSLGGVRRDVWLYNESSHAWARIGPDLRTDSPAAFEVTPEGPNHERLHGIYRLQ